MTSEDIKHQFIIIIIFFFKCSFWPVIINPAVTSAHLTVLCIFISYVVLVYKHVKNKPAFVLFLFLFNMILWYTAVVSRHVAWTGACFRSEMYKKVMLDNKTDDE